MHRHLTSSRKLYLNRRLLAVFSSNKRSGTGERASTLFSGFAVFKNSTRLHFSWRSRAVSRETWKVLDRSDESFLVWLTVYWIQFLLRLYRACTLDGLSFYERATIFCSLHSGKTPFPNKIRIPGAYFLTDKECEKSLPCPAPPTDDADKQLVPREAHHNLEMMECLQRKAVLIHQNISATNCGNQNVPIHSGRRRLNIKFRFIQLSKSDGYLVTIWLRLHRN